MKLYKFAPISARCFPTIADLNNPWIFPKDVAVVVSVTPHYDAKIAEAIKAKEIDFYHFPLEEEVDDIGWENIKQAVAVLLKYNKEGKRIIVHCDFGQHRSRLVVEAFYYAKFGEHFTDEYKGFDNHLIYDCFSCHLPRLDIVEQELFQLSQNNSSLTCIHSTETAINVSAIAKSIEFIGVDEADFALKNEMFARPKHELIHGITWSRFVEGGWKSISFGFIAEYLTPYCSCNQPMKKHQIIIGALMPTLLLGIIPGIIALFTGSSLLMALALVMIVGGGADMMIACKLLLYRSKCKEVLFIDHPYELGTAVFEK